MPNQCSNSRTQSACALRMRHSGALAIIGAFMLLWSHEATAQVNVTVYHYDSAGTGQNLNETTL
jgi:hypothetical protein